MRESTYNRPFLKAVPKVQSLGSGGAPLRSRIGQLRRGSRRGFFGAVVLSASAHIFAGVGLKHHLSAFDPPDAIGHKGPARIRTITPEDDPLVPQEELRRQHRSSAMQVIDIVIETSPSPTTTESGDEYVETVHLSPPLLYEPLRAPAPPSQEEPLLFQLQEDWTVSPSSPQAALAEFLIPTWIIVPDYPRLARLNDVEGRVLLEADVGISGRVLDVRVIEAADGSLTLAACRALLVWQFQPIVVDGEARKFSVRIPFRFRLE